MTGYVYAIRPAALDFFKLGYTANPVTRLKAFAAHSPHPVAYYRILDVGCPLRAKVLEQFALSWLKPKLHHGEWIAGVDVVDAALSDIAPAVDVTPQFSDIDTRTVCQAGQPMTLERLEINLAMADAKARGLAGFA